MRSSAKHSFHDHIFWVMEYMSPKMIRAGQVKTQLLWFSILYPFIPVCRLTAEYFCERTKNSSTAYVLPFQRLVVSSELLLITLPPEYAHCTYASCCDLRCLLEVITKHGIVRSHTRLLCCQREQSPQLCWLCNHNAG